MNEQRAVILEKDRRTLTVLTVEGEFRKFRYKGEAEVGEEISLPVKEKFPVWYFRASVAAVLLVAFTAVFAWTYQPAIAVAMLSLDINPSLQLTLDQKGKVLELQTLNQDAQNLLTDLSLEGEYWEDALTTIIHQSIDMDYLNSEEAWVVVGFTSLEGKESKETKGHEDPQEPNEPEEPKKPKEITSEKVINKETITQNIEDAVIDQGLTPKVAVYELTLEERNLAQEKDLSLGEYALINTAQKAGVIVEPAKVKERKERFRLLEMPEIQEQLHKDKGLGKLGLNLIERIQREDKSLMELRSRGLVEQKERNKSRGGNFNWDLKELEKWQESSRNWENWESLKTEYYQKLRDYYQDPNKATNQKKSQEKDEFPGNNNYKSNHKEQNIKGNNSNKGNDNSQRQEDWNSRKEQNRDKHKGKRSDSYQKDNYHSKKQELFTPIMQNFLIKIPSLAEHFGYAKF